MTTIINIPGQHNTHTIKVDYEIFRDIPPPPVSMSNYDATLTNLGQPGMVNILRGWMVRESRGETKLRAIPREVVEKINDQAWVEQEIYENTIQTWDLGDIE